MNSVCFGQFVVNPLFVTNVLLSIFIFEYCSVSKIRWVCLCSITINLFIGTRSKTEKLLYFLTCFGKSLWQILLIFKEAIFATVRNTTNRRGQLGLKSSCQRMFSNKWRRPGLWPVTSRLWPPPPPRLCTPSTIHWEFQKGPIKYTLKVAEKLLLLQSWNSNCHSHSTVQICILRKDVKKFMISTAINIQLL